VDGHTSLKLFKRNYELEPHKKIHFASALPWSVNGWAR